VGERGPAPRREAERRRRNKPAHEITKLDQEQLDALPFEIDYTPEPPDVEAWVDDSTQTGHWHPAAQELWDALQTDPARKWMTSADWALAAVVCESLSRDLRPQVVGITELGEAVKDTIPMKGASLSSYLKFMTMIGITEASRLRIAKEITLFPERPSETDGEVVDIRDARKGGVL
jgi:hypothetical protein